MRLIDADKLRKDILDLPNCYNGYSDTYDKACNIDMIDEQPTVNVCPYWDNESDYCALNKPSDAEPVRHGHWSPNPHNRAWDVCSACGIGTKRREYGINPDGTEYVTEYSYRYCPNCGAKMDEKRKER